MITYICIRTHQLIGGRCRSRAPRPMPVFQRSLSQHELHFRGGRLRGPVGRGWSDERLDVPRRRPPPAQAALQPTMLQHRVRGNTGSWGAVWAGEKVDGDFDRNHWGSSVDVFHNHYPQMMILKYGDVRFTWRNSFRRMKHNYALVMRA